MDTTPTPAPVNPADLALSFLDLDRWSIIPLEPKGIAPLVQWEPYQKARAMPDDVQHWFAAWPDANIGIVTGNVSRLVVLNFRTTDAVMDFATRCGGQLPPTPVVHTGDGVQLYFKHPAGPVPTREVLPGVMVHGEGSYVPGVGAMTPTGHVNRFLIDQLAASVVNGEPLGLAPLPGWLSSLLNMPAVVTPAESPPVSVPAAVAAAVKAKLHPNLIRLSDVKEENVQWFWQNRVPLRKVTLLIGDPDLGKTWITHDLAARSSVGAKAPDGGAIVAGNTLILTTEDGPADTVRPRIAAAGGNVDRVYVMRVNAAMLLLDAGVAELRAMITSTDARLIVFDPLVSFLGRVNPWKDSDVRRVMDPVASMAAGLGVAVVGIMHLTKVADRQALYRASGSVAFVAAARAVLIVMKDPEDSERRYIAWHKFNIGPKPPAMAYRIGGNPAVVQWESEPLESFNVEAVMARQASVNKPNGSGDRREAPRLAQAVVFLREFLAAGPRAAKDITKAAAAVGIAEQTLRRAGDMLAIKRHDPGTGRVWELPPTLSPLVMVEPTTTNTPLSGEEKAWNDPA